MKKILISGGVGVLLLCGIGWWTWAQRTVVPEPVASQSVKRTSRSKAPGPITRHACTHNRKLALSCLIYYGLHHTGIQRWQEAASLSAGWQVEIDHVNGRDRYSVWPDQHITTAGKYLEPNWFYWTSQRVSYHSFVVHSNGDYQIVNTTPQRVIAVVNRDHAAAKVHRMLPHLTIQDQRKSK